MAISVKGFDGNGFTQLSVEGLSGRFLTTIYKLVFSGTYPTGGDTLDFTNGGVGSAVPAAQSGGVVSMEILSNGGASTTGSNGGNYQAQKGTTVSNGKVKIFATAGSELANAGYPTTVTNDVVYLICKWAR